MIFEELMLKDFRQFAGEQCLRFATEPNKNVTVIHGFNGSGKTTLLNAFTWLLYNEFTLDFEAPEHLDSEAAFSNVAYGDSLTVSVRAVFRDGQRKYSVTRTRIVQKSTDGSRLLVEPGKLRLTFIDESGETREPSNPQDTLEQMLPRRLFPFFFFNGERIERLARADAYEEIGKGIKTLLDIELFDRSIGHLEGETSKKLRVEIARCAGEEGEHAREELDRLLEAEEKQTGRLRQFERNRAALEEEREAIDSKLASMPDLAKWQAERKAAEEREKDIKRQMKQRKEELAKEFSRSAYLLLTPDVLDAAKAVLSGARQKGEIPGPIKRQFVEDLLARRKCICDCELVPDTVAYKEVEQWRDRAFSDALESAVTVTQARIESFGQRAEECIRRINDLQAIRDELYSSLQDVQEELSELSNKIGDREQGEDPVKLERRRREVGELLTTCILHIADQKKALDELAESIRGKKREIDALDIADEKGKLAQRRLDAVSNVIAALKEIREVRYEELRQDLSDQLSDVWRGIAVKDYHARLDDDFRLSLTKDVGGQVEPVRGASTGEKQVLSLAFVGALIAKAKNTFERSKQANHLFRGGLYPLVIDSPFGNLEVEYRRDVAKWIPTLAPQLILMVSESQFRQEVEQELLPRIGKEWILKCETPRNTGRDIALLGRSYPYVIQSMDGFERTVFEEVEL